MCVKVGATCTAASYVFHKGAATPVEATITAELASNPRPFLDPATVSTPPLCNEKVWPKFIFVFLCAAR